MRSTASTRNAIEPVMSGIGNDMVKEMCRRREWHTNFLDGNGDKNRRNTNTGITVEVGSRI